VSVIQVARQQARAPINVMREHGLIRVLPPRPEPKLAPITPFIRKPEPPKPDAYLDAVALAQYIAKTGKSVPKDILAIVNRYASFMRAA
jgi:hypothetical protein